MKNYVKEILVLMLFCILLGCDNSSEPSVEKVPKEPGELIWKADTITYPGSAQVMMERIWAADSNNIWIIGHNDRNRGQIFKYDGVSWKEEEIFNDIPVAAVRLYGLWGFDKNNVYVSGGKWVKHPMTGEDKKAGLVLHYDGIKWSEKVFKYSYPLRDIWGSSPEDIWACGDSGAVVHYDGLKWSEMILEKPHTGKSEYKLLSVTGNKKERYFLGLEYLSGTGYENNYIFKIEGESVSLFDKCEVLYTGYKFGNRRISQLGEDLYSCGKNGLYRYKAGGWENLVNTGSMTFHHYESPSKTHWAVGYRGSIYYSKSSQSWNQLTQFSDEGVWYRGVWSDDYTTVIIGHTTGQWPQKTIVLTGK
ncbi:MAG: hypothetical protein ACEPO8_03030 [Rhodothermaceae bacterium]